ncbi:MAG: hypothetical protein R6U42_07485, partial [Halomonas sp.]
AAKTPVRHHARGAIDFVLFDSRLLKVSRDQRNRISDEMGAQLLDTDLANETGDAHHYDDTKLAQALLGLT